MKSHKIQSVNPNSGATDNNYIKVRDFNKIIEDLEYLFPLTNQPFNGVVDLTRSYTQYENYIINSTINIIPSGYKEIGASAEIRLIGDGVNTPTFTGFVASSSSDAYDPTLNAKNKVVFYYDGYDVFYSITVL